MSADIPAWIEANDRPRSLLANTGIQPRVDKASNRRSRGLRERPRVALAQASDGARDASRPWSALRRLHAPCSGRLGASVRSDSLADYAVWCEPVSIELVSLMILGATLVDTMGWLKKGVFRTTLGVHFSLVLLAELIDLRAKPDQTERPSCAHQNPLFAAPRPNAQGRCTGTQHLLQ